MTIKESLKILNRSPHAVAIKAISCCIDQKNREIHTARQSKKLLWESGADLAFILNSYHENP